MVFKSGRRAGVLCGTMWGGKKKDGNGNNVQCLVDRELERSLEGLQLSSA